MDGGCILLPLCIRSKLIKPTLFSQLSHREIVTNLCRLEQENAGALRDNIDFAKPSFIKRVAAQAFSLLGTACIFIIYRSLKHPSEHAWKIIVATSVSFIFFLGLAFMISGYLSFGDEVEVGKLGN